MHHPMNVIDLLREKMNQRDSTAGILKVFKGLDVGVGEKEVGSNDGKLELREVQLGLNHLLNLDMNVEESQKVIDAIDENKSGAIDIQELINAAHSPRLTKGIQQFRARLRKSRKGDADRMKRAEERARREHTTRKIDLETLKMFPGTQANREAREKAAKMHPKHRDAFYRPDRVLDRLRQQVKTSDVVRIFRLLDIGYGNDENATPSENFKQFTGIVGSRRSTGLQELIFVH